MPFDATVTFADGSQHTYKGVPDGTSPEAVQQQAMAEFNKQVTALDGGARPSAEGLKEAGRVIDKSVRGGLTALPGLIADIGLTAIRGQGEVGPQAGPMGAVLQALNAMMPGKAEDTPWAGTKFGDGTKALQTLGGVLPPVSEPQTTGGKYAGTAGEAAVSTIAGGGTGSWLSKAFTGGAAGLGSEGAAHLFGDNVFSRLLGSIVGGGAAAVAQGVKGNANSIVKQATEQMTDNDWRRAKVLEATLEREGIPHLKSQLLGPRSTLDDTVAVAGTNPAVRPKLISQVENSAEKARQSVERFNLANLPVNMGSSREVLTDVQKAAQESLNSIRGKANAAYGANMPGPTLNYMPEKAKLLRQDLYALADSPRFGPTSDAGRAIKAFADDLMTDTGDYLTNAQHWNNLVKDLNKKVVNAAEGTFWKQLPVEEVKRIMKEATPEFSAARAAKAAIMANEYNPASQGLAGDLARMGGGVRPDRTTARDTALSIVFPRNKLQPGEIVALSKNIGGDGVGELLREHLARSMESATSIKADMSQAVRGPFNFVETVAGTNAQRQNLEAALKVTAEHNGANPMAVRNGFYKLMRALETTKDLKLPTEIDRAALAQQAGKTLPGFAVAPNSRLGRYFWEKATAKTYNQIADMVLSKDGLQKLQEIAKAPSPELARQFAISIITGAGAGTSQEPLDN